MNTVGTQLKYLRESIRLSQAKIGELAELNQSTVNRYEHGNAEAPYRVLLWYADYFDVSLDYIFGRTDKPEGKLYNFIPQYSEDNENFKQFIEMCFDPSSPMNDKLKQTLIDMVTKGGGSA